MQVKPLWAEIFLGPSPCCYLPFRFRPVKPPRWPRSSADRGPGSWSVHMTRTCGSSARPWGAGHTVPVTRLSSSGGGRCVLKVSLSRAITLHAEITYSMGNPAVAGVTDTHACVWTVNLLRHQETFVDLLLQSAS